MLFSSFVMQYTECIPPRYRVLMDNFSPAQYERFEAYRRHALPKQAVRKVYIPLILLILSVSYT